MYRFAIAVMVLSTACAASLPQRPSSPDHPAHPAAPAAHMQELPRLFADASDRPASMPADAHRHGPTAPEAEPETQAPAHTSVVYTCPMHAEVRRTQPGKCPTCGMALVPAESEP